jgi:hypothetical protein
VGLHKLEAELAKVSIRTPVQGVTPALGAASAEPGFNPHARTGRDGLKHISLWHIGKKLRLREPASESQKRHPPSRCSYPALTCNFVGIWRREPSRATVAALGSRSTDVRDAWGLISMRFCQ